MHAWERIQVTTDAIEECLSEEIAIRKLAELAGLSPFYYQRLFHRLVGTTVNGYIKKRRLAKASGLLLEDGARIVDVALECGFSSHEVFTRAFKDAFGMPPESYRAAPVRLNQFTRPDLALGYTLVDEGVPLVTEGIVLEINRRAVNEDEFFLGRAVEVELSAMPTGQETSVDNLLGTLWDDFHEAKSLIEALVPGGEELGVSVMGAQPGFFRYFAGARSRQAGSVPGCESWVLPAGNYIVCAFEAEDFEHLVMDALYKAHRYLFDTWLSAHGIVTDAFAAERYPGHSPETTGMEVLVRIADSPAEADQAAVASAHS